MVCGQICADRAAPKSAGVAIGYKQLAIATTRRHLRKAQTEDNQTKLIKLK